MPKNFAIWVAIGLTALGMVCSSVYLFATVDGKAKGAMMAAKQAQSEVVELRALVMQHVSKGK